MRWAALRENQDQPARIRAETLTASPAPGTTRMLPEPDRISRSTGPLTFSVRSNEPSVACAAAGETVAKPTTTARTASPNTCRERKIMVEPPT